MQRGRSDTVYFDAVAGGEHYAEVLLRRRLKRGYSEADSERWKLLELEAGLEVRLRKIRRQLSAAREELRARAPFGPQKPLQQTVLWGEGHLTSITAQ